MEQTTQKYIVIRPMSEQIARQCGVNSGYVRMILSSKRATNSPTAKKIIAIADHLLESWEVAKQITENL